MPTKASPWADCGAHIISISLPTFYNNFIVVFHEIRRSKTQSLSKMDISKTAWINALLYLRIRLNKTKSMLRNKTKTDRYSVNEQNKVTQITLEWVSRQEMKWYPPLLDQTLPFYRKKFDPKHFLGELRKHTTHTDFT